MLRFPTWSGGRHAGAFALVMLVVLAGGAAWYFSRSPNISIGLVASLSGPSADMGIPARDGAILAVEDCNAAGGIRGAHVALSISDDQADPDRSADVVAAFARDRCWAVIGPTDERAAGGISSIASASRIATISPTVPADAFEGEYCFSVFPSRHRLMDYAVRHLQASRKLRNPVVIYHRSRGHALDALVRSLRTMGMNILATIPYDNTRALSETADFAATYKSDAILIIAPAGDAAILSQRLVATGATSDRFLVSPSSDSLLLFGGKALNGLTIFTTIERQHASDSCRSFMEHFEKRFGYRPPNAAIHAYEAANIALLSIAQSQTAAEVSQQIATQRSFDGLQGRVTFSEPGDTRREIFAITLTDGMLRSLE